MTLDEMKERRDEILEEMRSPDFNHDKNENATRDATIREFKRLCDLIFEAETEDFGFARQVPPGTIGFGAEFTLNYQSVIENRHEYRPLGPQRAFLTEAIVTVDMDDLPNPLPISWKSPIGQAIFGKVPGEYIVLTPDGVLKIEVSL